jgi:hypothetical protein
MVSGTIADKDATLTKDSSSIPRYKHFSRLRAKSTALDGTNGL